ncbi:hypothetical protein V2W45_1236432, partial [Cenococcum geophilum]
GHWSVTAKFTIGIIGSYMALSALTLAWDLRKLDRIKTQYNREVAKYSKL